MCLKYGLQIDHQEPEGPGSLLQAMAFGEFETLFATLILNMNGLATYKTKNEINSKTRRKGKKGKE